MLEADLAKLEAKVLDAAAGGWLTAIDEIRALLAAESPLVRSRILALVAPDVDGALLRGVKAALGLGIGDAAALVSALGRRRLDTLGPIKATPSPAAKALAGGLTGAGRDALAMARKLAQAGDLNAAAAPLLAHAAKVRRQTADGLNLAANQGVTSVADAAGVPTVWQAETNACVHCLAYSGVYAMPGKAFPGGLTYGAKSYYPDAIAEPPRHPNCRCTVEPLFSLEYAAALRREADRSVLRGFSLEGESMKVRVEAAERLVARGVDAPKSVVAYSRKSVAAGKFPTRGRPNDGPEPMPPRDAGPAPKAPKPPRGPKAPPSSPPPAAPPRAPAPKAPSKPKAAPKTATAKPPARSAAEVRKSIDETKARTAALRAELEVVKAQRAELARAQAKLDKLVAAVKAARTKAELAEVKSQRARIAKLQAEVDRLVKAARSR